MSVVGTGFLLCVFLRLFFCWLYSFHLLHIEQGGITRITVFLVALISIWGASIVISNKDRINDSIILIFAQSMIWMAVFLILGVVFIQNW